MRIFITIAILGLLTLPVIAAYLTGARTRFNTHVIDNSLTESEFYVQRVSTEKTVHVKLNPEGTAGID